MPCLRTPRWWSAIVASLGLPGRWLRERCGQTTGDRRARRTGVAVRLRDAVRARARRRAGHRGRAATAHGARGPVYLAAGARSAARAPAHRRIAADRGYARRLLAGPALRRRLGSRAAVLPRAWLERYAHRK